MTGKLEHIFKVWYGVKIKTEALLRYAHVSCQTGSVHAKVPTVYNDRWHVKTSCGSTTP